MTTDIWYAATAFVGLFALDWIWGKYINATAHGTPLAAALWAVPTYVVGVAITLEVFQRPWLLVPAALGSFAGTYYSVWQKRRKG